ncbi:protein-glutamine glutaminase family protein [Kangiella koreensis]|uniref:Protein glutaminase domain-containing protein n=1 Tax=Kangiella koreensis (strain DSM 16069 / JCM 12317 / KCTC 12182 / SW-125) TaxID=523791 RepID=C7R7Q8_KANKD|nr:protein-glutamine glutaminase family protein [Kangiella koreensis]ACV27591.1 hypothetical protein Kkor_2181 [Kangiella koreensis DSM 16069]
MKTKYLLALLLVLPFYAHATSVIYSEELQFDNCSTPKEVPIVYCKKDEDTAIIQIDERSKLIGIVLGNNTPKPFSVKPLSEDGTTNYFNVLSEKIDEDVKVPEYETPITIIKSLMEQDNSLSKNIVSAKQYQPEIVNELTALQELLVDNARKFTGEVAGPREPMYLFSKGNGYQECEELTPGTCPFMSCGDNHYLLFDRNKKLFLPISYTRNSKGEAKFTKNDPEAMKVWGLYATFIRYNEEYKHSRLTAARKVPENLQNNVTTYFTFQDPDFSEYLKDIIGQCPSSFKDDIISLGAQTNEERSAIAYVHLVEKVNGKITSQYINKAFLPAGIRLNRNSYFTHEALEDMSRFEPGSVKAISESKAKNLLKKAKAMKNMAWSQTQDGAFARAELMVDMFEKEGIIADKAWASGYLKSKINKNPWSYHVAPIVYVKGSRGNVDKMIIDPMIADHPVSIAQWLSLMGITNPDTVYSVGFPVSLDAKDVGMISFAITNRDAFHPIVVKSMSKEERIKEARRTLAKLEKG